MSKNVWLDFLDRNAWDICMCGDYRRDHPGNGPCAVCGERSEPWNGCRGFRFSRKSIERPK